MRRRDERTLFLNEVNIFCLRRRSKKIFLGPQSHFLDRLAGSPYNEGGFWGVTGTLTGATTDGPGGGERITPLSSPERGGGLG